MHSVETLTAYIMTQLAAPHASVSSQHEEELADAIVALADYASLLVSGLDSDVQKALLATSKFGLTSIKLVEAIFLAGYEAALADAQATEEG